MTRPKQRASTRSRSFERKLRCEALEDRRLLAVVTVDTVDDVVDFNDGVTSLREAVFATNLVAGADEIVFDFGIDGPATLLLTQGEIAITDSLTIDGFDAELLTIDAQQQSRIFNVDDGTESLPAEVTLRGITLTGGRTTGDNADFFSDTTFHGGAVRSVSTGSLTINSSVIRDNSTTGYSARGGGVYSYGQLVILDSIITSNSTEGRSSPGGGVYSRLGMVVLDSTFSENTTSGRHSGGAALFGLMGEMRIEDSSITGNSTTGDFSVGGGLVVGFAANLMMLNTSVSENYTTGFSSIGGGILSGGVLDIFDSVISNNHTAGLQARGGGINAIDLLLTSSRVFGNYTEGTLAFGGGIYSAVGKLISSEVSHNRTLAGLAHGGGIAGIDIELLGSTIQDNEAISTASHGGGVYAFSALFDEAQFRATASKILGNTAGNKTDRNFSHGGGLYIKSGSATIVTTTISENFAGNSGGGIYTQGNLEIFDSTLSGNSSGEDGGGIWASQSIGLFNSTVSGNQANHSGGGVFGSSTTVTVELSTITNNTADADADLDGDGGGIKVAPTFGGGLIDLNHSIVVGNHGKNGVAPDVAGIVNSSFSLIGFGAEFLGPLADNGGPTLTHALLPGSPAIDAGDSALEPGVNGTPDFDQRGALFGRVVGDGIDLGAFEAQPAGGALSADFDEDGDTDGGDFLAWQRGFGDATDTMDEVDLAVWEANFGEETLAEGTENLARNLAIAELQFDAAELVDVAVVVGNGRGRHGTRVIREVAFDVVHPPTLSFPATADREPRHRSLPAEAGPRPTGIALSHTLPTNRRTDLLGPIDRSVLDESFARVILPRL